MNWHTQKMCTDIGEYELAVERQKSNQHCEQNRESWKWSVNYHGAVIASGTANDDKTAQELAVANTPQ